MRGGDSGARVGAMALVVSALGLGVAACGGAGSGESREGAPAAAAAGPDTVTVALTEYSIGMPRELPPGPTVLRLENRGIEAHNLIVRPEGEDAELWRTEGNLEPGTSRTVELELEAGTYILRCDFAGHDARGMVLNLEVGGEPE